MVHVLLAHGLVCCPLQKGPQLPSMMLLEVPAPVLGGGSTASAAVARKSREPCPALHSTTFSIAYRTQLCRAAPSQGQQEAQNGPGPTAVMPWAGSGGRVSTGCPWGQSDPRHLVWNLLLVLSLLVGK